MARQPRERTATRARNGRERLRYALAELIRVLAALAAGWLGGGGGLPGG